MGFQIKFLAKNPSNLPQLTQRLGRLDQKLLNEMRKEIRAHARVIISKQRAAIISMPVLGDSYGPSSGLRKRIASGVRLKLRMSKYGLSARIETNARIRKGTSPAWKGKNVSEAILPRGLDSTFTGWAAPFMGRPGTVYPHEGSRPWFMKPAANAKDELEQDLEKLIDLALSYVVAGMARRAISGLVF